MNIPVDLTKPDSASGERSENGLLSNFVGSNFVTRAHKNNRPPPENVITHDRDTFIYVTERALENGEIPPFFGLAFQGKGSVHGEERGPPWPRIFPGLLTS